MRGYSTRSDLNDYQYRVYIFHGDEENMKRKPERKWYLYGLWTHSSCPVVQFICEENDRSARGSAEKLGLELLGHCVPQSNRQIGNRSSRGRWLVIQNDGVKLNAVLCESGSDLAPIRCYTKVLPMESPFSNHISRQSRRPREHSPERRHAVVTYERHDRPSERLSQSPGNTQTLQWYKTPPGEEILRNIHTSCISNFPAPSQVEMSRDAVDHNIQLTIKHNNKTFNIHFPKNFPQSSAHLLHSSAIYSHMQTPILAKNEEDIVKIVKSYCGCYQCKTNRR